MPESSTLASPKARTPLPKWQLTIIYSIQFAEPFSATVVYPFLPEFVRKTGITGGDEAKTGYYSGIIGSAFFVAECLTVFHWGRASDSIGRRPVLLIGPLGLTITLLAFGLSSNFWWLVALRALQGVFNGNIGVSKTMMAELTDSTNIGEAFAIMPVMWGLGSAIGPIVGGLLADPAQRCPEVLGCSWLFHKYPYLLPCGATALCTFIIFVCAAVSLKETHPYKQRVAHSANIDAEDTPLLSEARDDYTSIRESDSRPQSKVLPSKPPLREILHRDVVWTIVNYCALSVISLSYTVLMPLMYSTGIPTGGLGFSPFKIGVILAVWGSLNAVLQIFGLGKVLRRFGERDVFIAAMYSIFFGSIAFGLESYFARLAGYANAMVWALICIHLATNLLFSAAFAAIQILIVQSIQNPLALGATNGLAQMAASGVRGLAPSLTSALFSATIEHNLAGGFLVYFSVTAFAMLAIRLSHTLPTTSKIHRS